MTTQTIICGHRGGGGDPQNVGLLVGQNNTLDHYQKRDLWGNRRKTFELMLKQSIRCFEFDLLPSKEGEAIVVHDSYINGRHVAEQSTSELAEAGYITFIELLGLMDSFRGNLLLLTELKGSHSSENATDAGADGIHPESVALTRRTVEIITQRVNSGHWNYTQIPVIGFNHKMLRLAQECNPQIEVGLSFAGENFHIDIPAGLDDNSLKGAYNKQILQQVDDFIQSGGRPYAITPDSRFVDEALVKAIHAKGLKVQSWSAFRIAEKPEIIAISDIWITDCPLAAQKTLRQIADKRSS
ncbi:MAG TPA: glycerophosphodiester phosphodiesterase [Rickettsiales bacterium]|nr:glycerophosphodiester phosphodiesterase [Rickettsiales bacterium]